MRACAFRNSEKNGQAVPSIDCNGIHYSVIFRYGYCYCKEIEGLHNQPAAGTRAEGRGAGAAGQPDHERAIPRSLPHLLRAAGAATLDELGEYAAGRNPKGYTEADVPRLIKEVRAEKPRRRKVRSNG